MIARALTAFIAAAALVAAAPTEARIVAKTIAYEHEGAKLEGVLVYDDTKTVQVPGVLVLPEWWGLNDYARSRARQLAQMGYVAFAADMYGKGKVTVDVKQAEAWATPFYKNPEMMASRAKAGLEQLMKAQQVDPARKAAIGFCFGGSAVLQLVYSGEPLNAAVTFHGGLMPPTEAQKKLIRSPVAILHGAKDPIVKREDVDKTLQGFAAAGGDWIFVEYANATHAFSNPDADRFKVTGMAYNEKAAKRSWEEMQRFLEEQFTRKK